MNLKDLCRIAYEDAKAKGWYEQDATFGDRIALCHSELSEALEAYRKRPDDGYTWGPFDPIYVNPEGRLTREWRSVQPGVSADTGPLGSAPDDSALDSDSDSATSALVPNKPEGIPSELADTVIRIADMCGFYGIDLQEAVEQKMRYNRTRPHRHGGKKL